jgi:hypothetical protein
MKPLPYASQTCRVSVARTLLDFGANANDPELIEAIMNSTEGSRFAMLKLLVDNGAVVDQFTVHYLGVSAKTIYASSNELRFAPRCYEDEAMALVFMLTEIRKHVERAELPEKSWWYIKSYLEPALKRFIEVDFLPSEPIPFTECVQLVLDWFEWGRAMSAKSSPNRYDLLYRAAQA